MVINQIDSAGLNLYEQAQSKNLEGVDKAERTNTEQPQSESVKITTNGVDRVEISKEAQALVQQNDSKQKDHVETESDPVLSQIEAMDISIVV